MNGIINKREWASLMLVRVAKEPSRALPRHAYMDPSQSVMFEREREERRLQRAKNKRS